MAGAADGVIRLEIRIRNSGKEAEIMDCVTGYSNELRVQLVLIDGRACVELVGRTPEGATPDEVPTFSII